VPRPLRFVLAASAVAAFVVLSALTARVLTPAGRERDAVVALVRAQARGDTARVIGSVAGCRARPACTRRLRGTVARLRRPGEVSVLRYDGPARLALRARSGTARIVWRGGDGLPVVQCVRVRRTGSVLEGFGVRVLALSDPIGRETSC